MRPRGPPRGPPEQTRRRGARLVELVVDILGAQGDGIAQWGELPVYLPFSVPGDRVRAEIGAPRGGGFEARVVERLAAGPGRVAPACRHFTRCGGCALQHLGADDYRAAKLGALTAALARVGIDLAAVAPLQVVAPYRRRTRLGLARPRQPGAPVTVGFRGRFRHSLVDLAECAVLEPRLFALVAPLRQVAATLLAPGATAEAMLTRCDSGIDLLLEAAVAPSLTALEALAEFAAVHDLARIVWRSGRGDGIPVVERRPARVTFSGVAVALPPGGFLQASDAAEALLVREVVAGVGARRPVLDLYAGLGTFTFALAQAGPVHAVEGAAAAVVALSAAARATPAVSVARRDLDRDPLAGPELAGYAAAVFDPPRAGARRQVEAVAASAIATVVAVSCNPATFARDAAALVAGGFRLDRVVPIDQFVWTPHLELVATFRR